MWALGVTGTYLGDYFGILMDKPVTGFPFNVTGAPMYWGSTCSFLGTALYKGKPAGVLLTIQIFVMYLIALQFEEYVDLHLSMWKRRLTYLIVLLLLIFMLDVINNVLRRSSRGKSACLNVRHTKNRNDNDFRNPHLSSFISLCRHMTALQQASIICQSQRSFRPLCQ